MTGSSTLSQADSHGTRTSLRTLDKERIRQKALYLNMKEKLRMSICVRIQKVCKKSPQAAQMLSEKVLNRLQQEGLSSNISDGDLQNLVEKITTEKSSKPPSGGGDAKSKSKTPANNDETTKSKGSKKEKTPKESSRPTNPNDEESMYLTEAQIQQRSVGFVLPPKKSPKKHKQGDIWNELVQYQTLVEAQEAQSKQVLKAQKQIEWSTELKAQVAEKQRLKKENALKDGKYFEESMHNLEKMNQIEAQKETTRLQKAKEQNSIQEEQRQFKLKKKQAELEAKRDAEIRMAETIARQKKEEEAKEIARKQAEKVKMAQVLKENAEQLEKKRQLKMADRELELKLADDYIKMEEQKEAMRQKGLEEMSKRIQAKMKYFDDTSKAEMDMKNKEDELRILRYQADYEKKQAELDEKKRHDAMERDLAQQEYLKTQIKIKKEKERQEKEEYNKQAEMWRKEREANEKRERLLQQQKYCKNQLQQNWLKQQIQAKEQHALEADHTNLEVQLNQRLLHKLNELKKEPHDDGNTSNQNGVAAKTRLRSRELHEQERSEARKVADPRLKPATRK